MMHITAGQDAVQRLLERVSAVAHGSLVEQL